MDSSTQQLTESLHISRFSWLRFWIAALVSMLCSTVLVIYPNSVRSGDNIDDLLSQNIARSAEDSGGGLAWLCLFVVLTAMCYWALGKWKSMPCRAWIGGALSALLIAWTLTIPQYDFTIDIPGNARPSPGWFAPLTRPYYMIRWLSLTLLGVIVLSAVCSYWCETRDNPTTHRGRVVRWFSFRFSSVCALAGIIFLCWIPVFVTSGPVSIFVDTTDELVTYLNPQTTASLDPFRAREAWLNDQHPIFDTFLYGIVERIGKTWGHELGAFIVLEIVQAIACALALAALLCWIQSRTKLSSAWLVFIFAVIAFTPAFSTTMGNICKDSTWVPFFIAWVVCFSEYVYRLLNKERISFPLLTLIVIFSLLAAMTKKTSAYITCVSTLVLLLLPHFTWQRWKTLLAALVAPVLVLVIAPHAFYEPLRVEKGKVREVLAVPAQQVAQAVKDHRDGISKEEMRTITDVMDLDTAVKNINPSISNSPVKLSIRDKIPRAKLLAFMTTWMRLGMRYPHSYATAVPYLWDSFVPGMQTNMGVRYIYDPFPVFLQDHSLRTPRITPDTYSRMQKKFGFRQRILWETVPPFNFIGQVCLYSVWIPILAILECWMRRRYFQLVLLLPSVLNTAVLLVVQHAWYRLALGVMCAFPLALAAAWVPQADHLRLSVRWEEASPSSRPPLLSRRSLSRKAATSRHAKHAKDALTSV